MVETCCWCGVTTRFVEWAGYGDVDLWQCTDVDMCRDRCNRETRTKMTQRNDVKQVIVVRSDIGMTTGKIASQAAHASIAWLSKRIMTLPKGGVVQFNDPESEWLSGSFTKIVLKASLEDMMHVYYEAQEHGLEAHLIVDEGRTVFDGIPTPTAVGIGPDYPEKIDPITGALKLYR